MSEEEQSTTDTLEVSMETVYYKEEDDDPSPFLEEGNDDDKAYNRATRVWPDGCMPDQLTHLGLIKIKDPNITVSNIIVIITNT